MPDVSPTKSKSTKVLRSIFGPKAYFQTTTEPAGLRALAWHGGRFVEIAKATLKPDAKPTEAERATVLFALLQASGRSVNREITLEANAIVVRKLAAPAGSGRLTAVQEADLCDALQERQLGLLAPCCEGCTKCDPTDGQARTPCVAWGQWAIEQIKTTPIPKPEEPARLEAEGVPQEKGPESESPPA